VWSGAGSLLADSLAGGRPLGTDEDVLRLLDHGADPNGGSAGPDTLNSGLTWAVFTGRVGLVRLMLDRGLDLRDERHRAALLLAAERGHGEMVQLLIENGADPHVVNNHGQTPLELARMSGREAVVALLETR
jgi:ankyrin repeat protein